MRRIFCVLLLLLPLSYGCGSRQVPGAATPTEAAIAFHRLAIEARWPDAAEYLADEDVALWADGHRYDQYPELGLEAGGAPGVQADSARLRSRRGDTALVDVFVSGPDWSDRRWSGPLDSLYQAGADRSELTEAAWRLRRTVPLERTTQTVPVIRQGGRWRVWLGLRIRERFRSDAMSRWSEAASARGSQRTRRLRAASGYLALADSFPALADTSIRSEAAETLRSAPYVDSVEVHGLEVLPSGSEWRTVRRTARNVSATELKWVTIHVMDGTGYTDEVTINELPPRSTVAIDLGTRLEPGKPRAAVVAWVGGP
jgi:hypothetical protein